MLLLLAVAVVYSLQRTPVYTAEARLTVSKLDLSQPGALNGFGEATQSLATAYSRSMTAQEVIQPVAAQSGLDPLEVRGRLSSTPIPDSPLFRIEATGVSSDQAVQLANSAAEALRDYVNRSSTEAGSGAKALLLVYRDKQERAFAAAQALEDARRAKDARPTDANIRAIADAEARYSAARLEAEAAASAYTARASAGSSTQGVDILTTADSATNDRRIKMQIYAFVALVLGGFLGAALATFTEDRRYRRALYSRVR
jgi:hypothetical protein